MRLIHTSDWHLGRNFGAVPLYDYQKAFTEWLVGVAIQEGVDLVIVAGDIYDRAIPPVEAIELFTSTVGSLTQAGIAVAAITGNHDAADRVAPYLDMMDSSRFYLRGGYSSAGEVLTIDLADGPIDLVLVPYLEPRSAPDDYDAQISDQSATGRLESTALGNHPVPDGDALVKRRLARSHAQVMTHALNRAQQQLVSLRSIVVAHAFVTGGTVSDSERQLVVGGTGEVPSALFKLFSYTALGHLHRPQSIGSSGRIRYSGTPLPYSFSEEHQKSVSMVDLGPAGNVEVHEIVVPVGRAVATVRGEIDDLLNDPQHLYAEACFLRAIVTNRETVLDAKAKLAVRFPHIIEVQLQPYGEIPGSERVYLQHQRHSPLEVATQFWQEAEDEDLSPETLALLTQAAEVAVSKVAQ